MLALEQTSWFEYCFVRRAREDQQLCTVLMFPFLKVISVNKDSELTEVVSSFQRGVSGDSPLTGKTWTV